MSDTKTVLITGTSSGFGLLTARTLAAKGHHVFATMRGVTGKNKDAAKGLTEYAKTNNLTIEVLELDVTSDESVTTAMNTIIKRTGRIDVVVNNAGLGAVGPIETYTPEAAQRLFEVNVFGCHRVNRAALPHMRKAHSGLLIHTSSIIGRVGLPFFGFYCASKYALEGLVESIRGEVSAFGVDAVIIEPGAYPTTEFGGNVTLPDDADRASSYGALMEVPEKMFAGMGESMANNMPDPQDVADATLLLIETPYGTRPLRTVVDRMAPDPFEALNKTTDQVGSGMADGFGINQLVAEATKKLN